MAEMLLLFAIVYALNVIPAFAPPTWMALSFVGFNDPTINSRLAAPRTCPLRQPPSRDPA
jgi:hypothetical protein